MKQYPNSKEIEDNIIGSLLINPGEIVKANISADDFYWDYNKTIFETIQKLYAEKKAIDPVVICNTNKSIKLSELSQIMADTISSLNLVDYCQELKTLSNRRQAIRTAEWLATKAFDNKSNMDKVISEVMTKLTNLSQTRSGAVHIGEVVRQLADEIDKAIEDPKTVFGIPTHMRRLNKILAGFQVGEVVKLSGDPGVGKSLLAFQWVLEAASGLDNIPPTTCAVFQLEMNRRAQVRRALSHKSGIRTRAMRSGYITNDELANLYRTYENVESLPIFIDDNPGHTTTSLRAEIARLRSHNVKFVLIDYEALLNDQGEENERTAKISDQINAIAKDMQVAILTINDQTKAGMKGKTKGQAALAGSRRVIYNADVVMFLRKTDTENEYLLEIEKYREGDTDELFDMLIKAPGRPSFAEKESTR